MTFGVDTASGRADVRPASAEPDSVCDPEHGCITCGDIAEEMRVVGVDERRDLALCEDERGERHTVEIALVHPLSPADTLLVHAGTAIANLGGTL